MEYINLFILFYGLYLTTSNQMKEIYSFLFPFFIEMLVLDMVVQVERYDLICYNFAI